MKDIILRKATINDFEKFKFFYDDAEKSLVYGYTEENVYTGEEFTEDVEIPKEVMDRIPDDILKIFKEKLKGIFFIVVKDEASCKIVGYIEIIKDKKLRRINDLVIRDNNSINEKCVSKIIDCLFNITKTDGVYLYVYSYKLKKILRKIGFFEGSCCLQKKAIGK